MIDSGAPHPAEAELFDDTLSCDLALPVAFEAGATVQRPGASEMLLRSVALVEDSRSSDDADERTDASVQMQRLEARLDLTLVLLGRLLQQSSQALPMHSLRWSRHGLRIDLPHSIDIAPGTTGVVRLQPAEWLPDHIELPVVVLAQAGTAGGARLWLRLRETSDAFASALERHLFRLHRRQIAGSRRAR